MKLTCLLSLSNHFSGNGLGRVFDDTYVQAFFESTKKFLNIQLERDGYVFLKDALKVFGFKIRGIEFSKLCKAWVYKNKQSKVNIRLRKVRIKTGVIGIGKNEYTTDYAIDFIVPDYLI